MYAKVIADFRLPIADLQLASAIGFSKARYVVKTA
jgi:hypothetical protein